jgi:hypothetical protein
MKKTCKIVAIPIEKKIEVGDIVSKDGKYWLMTNKEYANDYSILGH